MMGLGSARRRSWGSLTTHLQEVLPAARGEQSLSFKESPGVGSPSPESIANMGIVHPWHTLATQTMSEITEWFELVHQ